MNGNHILNIRSVNLAATTFFSPKALGSSSIFSISSQQIPIQNHQLPSIFFSHLGTEGNHFQLAPRGLDRVPVELWILRGIHIPRPGRPRSTRSPWEITVEITTGRNTQHLAVCQNTQVVPLFCSHQNSWVKMDVHSPKNGLRY